MKIRVQVKLPTGDTDGESEQSFAAKSVIIGSGTSAALRIEHEDVSSMHAILKVKDGNVTISDLGSEAGTSVNGKPITDAVPVEAGDKIALGAVEISVSTDAALEPKNVTKKDDKSKLKEAAEAAKETASDAVEATKETAGEAVDAAKEAAEDVKEAAGDAAAKVKKGIESASEAATALIKDPDAEANAKAAIASVPAARSPLDDGLDESFLSTPLIEANQPTAAKHALEIKAHWGDTVLDEAMVSEPRGITVSGLTSVKKADLACELPVGVTDFTVAVNHGTEASIVVPSDAKVGLRKADGSITHSVSLAATDAPFPAKAYQLGFGERLAFKVGTITFTAEYVRGEAAMGKSAPLDWYFPRIFILSAMIHAFFVAAAFVTPKLTTSLTDDLFKNQNRFAQMILKAPEKEKKRKKLDLSGSKGGAKHKGDEGKFGKKNKPKKDALASKAGAPRVDPNKREKDRKIAMNSGLLGILKGGGGAGAVSNVFGPGGLGTGINNAMGGLRGTAMGDAGGAGGLGTRGAGAGGGGNSLGIGGLGTHGHGRGTGGYGNIDLGGRGKGTTRVVPGRTIIKGSLSKQEIGRVIRRNLARFKYCYEKQLNANPNLSGKISVYFTIAPTGGVAKATVRETSMNDSKVEGCVTKVMKSLKFPQPKGGGIVVVTYPFVFAST